MSNEGHFPGVIQVYSPKKYQLYDMYFSWNTERNFLFKLWIVKLNKGHVIMLFTLIDLRNIIYDL